MSTLDKSNPQCVEFPFGTLTLFARHAEGRFRLGVDFGEQEASRVIGAINAHFSEQSCGYISVREASYSVNPLAAQKMFNRTIIKCASFVLSNPMGLRSFEAEKAFYKIPTKAVFTLAEAEAFVAETLAK